MVRVIDASVAFKWFIPEDDSDLALAILDTSDQLLAPELILSEVANALWVRLRRADGDRTLVANEAVTSLQKMLDGTARTAELLPRAITLAFELTHPVYDCLYLALAERDQAVLVSADKRLIEVAQNGGYGALVEVLS